MPQALNMQGLHRVLNMPKCVWIVPEYAWLCLNMPEYAWIYVNIPKSVWTVFALHFFHCNPLSTLTRDYLFQRLRKTRSYSLKEHETVFLTRQDLIFLVVAGSMWFNFCFRLIIFASKISIFLLPFGTEGAGGLESWYTYDYDLNNYKTLKSNKQSRFTNPLTSITLIKSF